MPLRDYLELLEQGAAYQSYALDYDVKATLHPPAPAVSAAYLPFPPRAHPRWAVLVPRAARPLPPARLLAGQRPLVRPRPRTLTHAPTLSLATGRSHRNFTTTTLQPGTSTCRPLGTAHRSSSARRARGWGCTSTGVSCPSGSRCCAVHSPLDLPRSPPPRSDRLARLEHLNLPRSPPRREELPPRAVRRVAGQARCSARRRSWCRRRGRR